MDLVNIWLPTPTLTPTLTQSSVAALHSWQCSETADLRPERKQDQIITPITNYTSSLYYQLSTYFLLRKKNMFMSTFHGWSFHVSQE